ncbi:MAG: TonB-dependent receptor [Parasphingorhabdus sp.]
MLAAAVMFAVPLWVPIQSVAAQNSSTVSFDVPAGTLGPALTAISRQAKITVFGNNRNLSSVKSLAVNGRYSAKEALDRLLRNTPYFARQINPRTFRIERRVTPPRSSATVQARQTKTTKVATPPVSPLKPIIVSATKRNLNFRDYPGGADRIALDEFTSGQLGEGLDKALSRIPVTSGTALGTGRNKTFIRGIADSSFNGPTQSTIGMYLGEQRLIYSASNPDLRLYDMDSVELLEGPQGTLYGAGAIGGVIRMVPKAPQYEELARTVWGSAAITKGGAPSYDLAVMANLPLGGTEALRAVAYKGQSGGYIDDSFRDLENVNRTRIEGGRLAFRSEISPNWTLNVNGFGQMTEARDGQYIDRRFPGLTQRNQVGQAFDSEILGLNLMVRGALGDLDILSTTGVINHHLDTRYDATVLNNPGQNQLYDEARKIILIDHETRISDNGDGPFTWLIGASVLDHEDDIEQLIINLDGQNPPPFVNIVYNVREYALFGEASYKLRDGLTATLGGRLAYTKGNTTRTFGAANPVDPKTDALRFLPVAGLSLKVADDITAYVRYQHGFRTAGITVERADQGDPIISRFDADKVQSIETGLKGALNTDALIDFTLAGFFLKWRDIQADLIQDNGFTFTRNIGDAEIFGISFQSSAVLTPQLKLNSSFFLNDSEIMRQIPNQGAISSMLPNIAPYGARLAMRYEHVLGDDTRLIGTAGLNYTGKSVLDIGPTEQVRQGNYASADISINWQHPTWEIGLEVNNITNSRGNRFAFGNPFTIRRENQQVPLRPFSIRISAKLDL